MARVRDKRRLASSLNGDHSTAFILALGGVLSVSFPSRAMNVTAWEVETPIDHCHAHLSLNPESKQNELLQELQATRDTGGGKFYVMEKRRETRQDKGTSWRD